MTTDRARLETIKKRIKADRSLTVKLWREYDAEWLVERLEGLLQAIRTHHDKIWGESNIVCREEDLDLWQTLSRFEEEK